MQPPEELSNLCEKHNSCLNIRFIWQLMNDSETPDYVPHPTSVCECTFVTDHCDLFGVCVWSASFLYEVRALYGESYV